MNRRARLAAASLAAAATIAIAAPANASGASCNVSPDHAARLSVTRYAKGSGIEYHMDLNSSISVFGPDYYQKSITISGVTLPGTDDQYRDFVGTQTRTIRGYWTVNGATVSCAVTL